MNQATASGDPIYALYRAIGPDLAAVCTAGNTAGGGAYGKWLDTSTPPDTRINC